jgi:two-component system chemotaxis sensor kinase CheA
MDELLEQFVIEGRELIVQAEAELERLAGGADDAAALDGLFRAFHTLKGSVQIFDLAPAERLLHAAEDRLMAARKAGGAIEPKLFAALVACIDQTDRWIDEMERQGHLGAEAGSLGEGLLDGFAGAPSDARVDLGGAEVAHWLPALQAAAAEAIARLDGQITAFRYVPDADAFFRGDDPLGIVAAVPQLEHLAIEPVGLWPALEDWDPFQCVSVIEGLSAAPPEAVRAAFKLVPDQVQFATFSAESSTASGGLGTASTTRTMRVESARIDRLATEVGELVVAANGLAHVARLAERADPELAAALRAVQADIDRISGALHRAVAGIRLVPLAPALRQLPRLVREIAAATGKPVQFEMRGDTVEVDKQIADSLFEPLLHIVRNAIDHGLEGAGDRSAKGKSPTGRVVLTASRQGDEVVVAVSDDGAGIDPAHVRDIAITRGVIERVEADELSDIQARRLILMPGFSTAEIVTDLSGRGVGMDAVKAAAERLRGRVVIDSEVGVGTTIELRLPLDAITTRLLVVRAGAERYGVPLDQIVETARLDAGEIRTVGRGRACVLRDRTVPLLDLADLLGAPRPDSPIARLLVTETGGEPVAIRVDGFERRIDAIMRENDGLLQGVPGMAGSAVLSDGSVLLVLDLPELVA